MMKKEFQDLAGYQVSDHDYYNIIEPMYYASDLDKADFIKCLNRKRFEIIPAKSPARLQLERDLKEELADERKTIRMLQDDLALYKQYRDEDPEDDFWSKAVKNQLYFIKWHKDRVKQIKFILE